LADAFFHVFTSPAVISAQAELAPKVPKLAPSKSGAFVSELIL
jgi:hypothetical protein